MSRKTRKPKFNSVLQDFRKFAGLKEAEEQRDGEKSVSIPGSDPDARAEAPHGAQPVGTTSAGLHSDLGNPPCASPDRSVKTTGHTKEMLPITAKLAEEDVELVNSLLAGIDSAIEDDSKGNVYREQASPSKIASQIYHSNIGEEFGRMFALGLNKVAEGEEVQSGDADIEEVQDIIIALQELIQEGQITEEEAQGFLQELNDAIASSKTASLNDLEELTKRASYNMENSRSEDEQYITKVASEAAMRGYSRRDINSWVNKAYSIVADSMVKKAQEDEIEAVVNQKVAELASAGYTDAQIQQYLVRAGEMDAMAMNKRAQEAEYVNRVSQAVNQKIAKLANQGYSDAQIVEYIKQAAENDAAALSGQEAPAGEVDELQAILIALQELVQSGQISEEQAQAFLAELSGAVQGGGAPQEAGIPEEAKQAMEQMVNQKVAELVSQGYNDAQITEYIKQAAENDAAALSGQEAPAGEGDELQAILIALQELVQEGQISEEQAQAFLAELSGAVQGAAPQEAAMPEEVKEAMEQAVNQKVAELVSQGYNDAQITEYIKQAAVNDAVTLSR